MAEISHSSGPWSVDGPVHSIIVYAADGSRVCFMTSDGPAEANAHLIAAAPDLLAALKHARANMPHPDMMVDLAIAKAEGRSNG